MANHLTPTELAREAGLERREVITKCVELGVPIFQGRIDKTLFLANMSEQAASRSSRAPGRSGSGGSGSCPVPPPTALARRARSGLTRS